MNASRIHGVWTALITPFDDQKIDWQSFERILNLQSEAEVHGVVVAGSTGEGPNLTIDEKSELTKFARKLLPKSIRVMTSVGSSSTKQSIEQSNIMMNSGADSLLVATPAYNKPTLTGLVKHYEALNELGAPICLYHVPGRTAQRLSFEALAELIKIKNIVAVKEATADLDLFSQLTQLEVDVLSGDDPTFLPSLAIRGSGLVSVLTNVMPKPFVEIYTAFESSDWIRAQEIHFELSHLIEIMGIETNPGPVKAAAEILGLAKNQLRLPLAPVSQKNYQKIQEAFKK